MDFGVAPPISEALARLARNQEYGYAARDGDLAAAFARRMQSGTSCKPAFRP
jgi:bifunctional pyridoxal-dependent enzyme with beta-cystathionase and maltose regulon repressor activities